MVDDAGQIHVNWENGSSLALVAGSGFSFHKIGEPAIEQKGPRHAAIPVTFRKAGLDCLGDLSCRTACRLVGGNSDCRDAIQPGQESF